MIDDSLAKGIPVETRFHRFYADAIFERIRLGPAVRESMQLLERDKQQANAPELLSDFMVAIGRHNQRVEKPHVEEPQPAQQ